MLCLQNKSRGLTLAEALVVLLIFAILLGLALAQYNKTNEHSYGLEAKAALRRIAEGEKNYRLENGTSYYPASGTVTDLNYINGNLSLLLKETHWNYSITGYNSGGNYTAYANRNGTGGYLDCVYAINDTTDEPIRSSQCPP